jgi:protein-disulfide isomerase
MQPLDEAVDHMRGGRPGPAIVAYGDYQCAYSLVAVRELERVERRSVGEVRVAFRHFPQTHMHPHAPWQ